MVIYGESDNEKRIIVNCNCGCSEGIHIYRNKVVGYEYFMTICTSNFYNKQRGIIRLILHRIKLAFLMLIGKEYLLSDVLLSDKDLEDLKDYLNEVTK